MEFPSNDLKRKRNKSLKVADFHRNFHLMIKREREKTAKFKKELPSNELKSKESSC